MPEIPRFLGIVIGMFYSEHGVAHFHAAYGEYEVSMEIESGAVHGEFPARTSACTGVGRASPGRNSWRIGAWLGPLAL
jgi:hypothetical protein